MSAPVLHLDFETRGVLDLREVGLHRYARDPNTDVWCMAGAIGETEPALSLRTDTMWIPPEWALHVKAGLPVYAHNAPFELEIWNQICVPRYGWPELKPEQTFCTMAMCYAMGLPGALEDAALALGLHVLKDAEGRSLMLRMARPRSNKNGKLLWWNEQDKLERLYAYCQQDVRVERELHKRLMPLSDKERKVWLLDYKINQRGVLVDIESAKAAIKLAAAMKEKYDADIAKATDGAATTCTALGPIKDWLAAHGCADAQAGLAKQDVIDLLDREDLDPAARHVLTLRQEAGKASAAKFGVMVDRAGEDNRLRQLYQYHGAATGRWAARGVQVHNLIRNMPKPEAVEKILDLVRRGEYEAIDMIYGPPLSVLTSCMRSFFVAPEGKVLVSGDFSNVESRGGAWFAGEQWKLDAFRAADAGTGPDVYRLGASKALGIAVDAVTDEQRQARGKVPDLAFLYQGGVGSGKTMGKTYGVHATDREWDDWKNAWRDAHPAIAGVMTRGVRKDGAIFWYRKGGIWKEIEQAAINAVLNPGVPFACGYVGRQATYKMAGSFLWCLLPSGRVICYPYPKILQGEYGPQLTYMTVPGPDKTKVIYDIKNTSNWARVGTYGGALLNNIDQGFCRDFLADLLLALDDKGAAIVLHTHDDGNIEVDEAKAEKARAAMEKMMRTPPAWAKGFPLFAKCSLMRRYGKS